MVKIYAKSYTLFNIYKTLGKKKKIKKLKKISHTADEQQEDVQIKTNSELTLNLPGWVRSELFLTIGFFVFGFVLYAISLNNEFVWDDVEVIKKSYFNFERSTLKSIIIPAVSEVKKLLYYRPTIPMTYIVDWNFWKLNPFGYHLSNSIYYSFTIVAIFFLSRRLAGIFNIKNVFLFSVITTLLFTMHPMHVESVSWIAGRTDVLCTMFFLFALGFHILSHKRLYLIPVVCLFYIFALFSKEVAVAFPFLVICMDFLVGRALYRSNIVKYAVYLFIMGMYLYLRSRSFVNVPEVYNQEIVGGSGGADQFQYYLNMLKIFIVAYAYYLKQLFFPYTFNSFVTYLPTQTLYTFVSIILISVIVIFFFYSYRAKKKFITLNIFWVLLTLGPSVLIAIFAFIATPVSERYLFLPSAGFCLLIGYILTEFIDKPGTRKISLGVTAILLCSYLFFTIDRQSVWKTRLNLWQDASSKSDRHAIPHINYGMALLDAGRTDEAIEEFNISLRPGVKNTPTGRAIAANNLGVAYINKRDYKNAAKTLLIALESDPSFHKTYYHFGLLYYIKANTSKLNEDYMHSQKYLVQATQINPRYGKAFLLLAKLNSNFGQKKKAVYYAKKAIQSGLIDQLAEQARKIIQINS